ncbi:hypothetical protein IJ818_01035 [bacterium]|nr:hypothetical protein [bacterium]
MADSLSVSFQYTKEDILNVAIESLGFDIAKCWLILITAVIFFCLGVYFLWIKLYIAAIILIFAAILFVPIYIFIAYLNLSTALKVLTDCVYTIEKKQLIAGSNLGFQYFDLKDIDRVVLTKPVIFIYVTKKNAYFIPIRAFNSEEKANKFITELQYGIETAKKEAAEIENL